MKKLILPILIVLISVPFFSPVLAKNPQDIKINCPNISSTLRFTGEGEVEFGSDLAYSVCKSEMGGVKFAKTIIKLGGDIHIGLPENLPEELSDPNIPDQTRLSPAKTENLLIGDAGKIHFWGPPWEQGSSGDPYVQYKAKLGNCYLNLWGAVQNDLDIYFKEGGVMPDWQGPADFMVGKLSAAAKEIEGKIAEECGAKNVIDNPVDENGQQVKPVKQSNTDQKRRDNFINAINVEFEDTEISFSPTTVLPTTLEPPSSLDSKGNRWDFLQGFIPHESVWENNVLIAGGVIHITLPNTNEKIQVNKNEGVEGGSIISVTMPTRLLMNMGGRQSYIEARPNQSVEAVMRVPKTEAEYLFLEDGEVEIVVDPQEGSIFGVETPNGTVTAIHTHFVVSYDKRADQTTVAVYDGEVEFKTKDGKTARIAPNGNQPGVLAASQKLSIMKLAIAGVVLAGVVGSIVMIFIRKFASKGVNKRKK